MLRWPMYIFALRQPAIRYSFSVILDWPVGLQPLGDWGQAQAGGQSGRATDARPERLEADRDPKGVALRTF